jgi:hypothetical protein
MCTEPNLDRMAGTLECLAMLYLANPTIAPLPATPQGLDLLIDALAAQADERSAGAICAIANRMPYPEWGVKLLTKASASLAF